MRKLFSILAATLFATTMFAAVQEFTMTIASTDFNSTSYAANNNEKTTTAVATADPSVTMDVKWTSNQIMLGTGGNAGKIQGQKNTGLIYNSLSWGKIKSITINDNSNYTYTIGNELKPSASAEGGFFQIKAGSSTSLCTSIVIKFEADPAAASLHADNIELGDMLVEPNEAFEKVVTINVEASNLSAPIAFSTESPMLSFGTPSTTLPATGGELKVKITANHGDVINETVLLSSGSLSATVTISGEVWEKYYTPGTVDVEFEAGVKAQGGDTTFVNGQKAVKVGTSNDPGTAIITIPAGATKLYFLAAAWSGKACTITLSASGIDFSPTTADLKADAGIANNSPFFTKSGNLEQYLVELELNNVGAETDMTVTATGTNKRFVIWDVTCDKGDTPTPPTPGVIEITNSDDTYYGDYVDDEGYWIFEVETSTYYLTLSNLDLTITQAAGTYTAAELDPEYTYLLTETDSIWFVDGSITLAVSGETTTIKGDLVGKDGNTYRLNLSCAPNPYKYDEDVNYAATFDSYEIDDTDFDDSGFITTQASQDGKGVMIGMFLPATATEAVPVAGTYPINDTYQPQTVAAGYFDETEGLIPSIAALISGTSATNIWYLVSGTVTVNEYKTLTVVAKNSKNRDITITLKGEDEPTSIANTKAANLKRKAIKNGHLFINANNVEYNVNGARVK